MGRRDLRATLIGEAGTALALVLAGIAALTTFVAAAGPRELASEQIAATRRAADLVSDLQRAIYASAYWFPTPAPGTAPTLAQQATLAKALMKGMPQPIQPDARGARVWITGPLYQLVHAAPQAVLLGQPFMQVSYDSELPTDCRLLAGRLPTAITRAIPGSSAADHQGLAIQVAVTPATAARFSLRLGSLIQLAPVKGQPPLDLQVTAIVAPSPGTFWNSTQVVADPSLVYHNNYWLGGAVIGQSELMALQATLWSGKQVQGVWFVPVKLGGLTPALVAPLSNAITAQAAGIYGQEAESASRFKFGQTLVISSPLPADLALIQSQLSATNSLDSFVIAGIFAAALLLILLSAGLAADRYQAEFSLLRVRGSSVGQVAFVALARAAAAAGPGIAAGLAAAIVVLPRGSGSVTAWLLPGLVALFVFVGIPARSAWRVRRAVQPADTSRAEIAAPRRSMRRWLAELTIVAAGVAAVVALETRGLAAGQNELALAIPVLVAATVSIALARLYPIPVRMLLPLATRRRGPVGFLGLARAGRSGMSTIVPALALVLTMTLAALGWMLAQSVYAGQVTTSWVQSGADAVVTATLNNTISAADQHRLAAVPGVRRTALAYTSTATSPFAATLLPASDRGYETTGSFTTGLMVIDPGPYAALAGQTPWPGFPASALARRPGPVPVLISAGAAPLDHGRAVTGTRQNLDLGGITIPVVVEGIIGATPAEPAGGNYVVLPAWAAGNFPSIPGMTTFMATGPRLSPAAMTRAARTLVPGGPVVIRSSVLHQLRSAASEYEVRLFIVSIWITVALSLVALGFGLTATTQSRRHLRTRMAALGMSGRQTRALALTDAIPLLVVAVLGMVAAGTALVVISGHVINLGPLTGATGEVAVNLDWPALAVPGALAIILALAGIAIENWRAARAESAAALRTEEA